MQSLTGLKSLYEAKEVAIHVLGKKPEGDLSRPFAAAPGMFGGTSICYIITLARVAYFIFFVLQAAGAAATDAASIKAAEEEAKKTK